MTSDERTEQLPVCGASIDAGVVADDRRGRGAAPAYPCRCHGNDAQPATYGRPRHTLTYQTTHAYTCTSTEYIYV